MLTKTTLVETHMNLCMLRCLLRNQKVWLWWRLWLLTCENREWLGEV